MKSSKAALVAAAGLLTPALAHAQTRPPESAEVEEVVVTGSYLPQVRESLAQPVDVVTRENLEAQGGPNTTQLIKSITTGGVYIGEANRGQGRAPAGNATINLRNLGSARTLTLMNGRRMAEGANGGVSLGANLRFIPFSVVDRVEVLRDGASATYGSDAVGGVVNFITRRDLEGFEAEFEYSSIQDSGGDYNVSVAWGKQTDGGNLLFAAQYRHAGQLMGQEREWFANLSYDHPQSANWTAAHDITFYRRANAPFSTIFRDNGCQELGGVLVESSTLNGEPWGKPITAAPTTGNICRFPNAARVSDLVSRQDDYHLHAEINQSLGDGLQFHAEATWFRSSVPDQRASTSNVTGQFPTPSGLGGTADSAVPPLALNNWVPFHVPGRNPGFQQLAADCAANGNVFGVFSAAQCSYIRQAAVANAFGSGVDGVDIGQTTWRPAAFAGNPLHPDGTSRAKTENTGYRISAGLSGELPYGIRFDSAVTFHEMRSVNYADDMLVNRVQDALNGFGSRLGDANQCTAEERRNPANAGNAAAGCYYFNPFSNSINVSPVTNQQNPFFRPNVANDPLVVANMYGSWTGDWTNQMAVADAVLSGEAPIQLSGGAVAWAVGGQLRYDRSQQTPGGFADRSRYPCVDSIDDGIPGCTSPSGPMIFIGADDAYDLDRVVGSVFAELRLPLTDRLEANLALRHERYGRQTGSTTDPRVALRWEATDWLAFRTSYTTSFRAPPQYWVVEGFTRGAGVIGGQFRQGRLFGHADLKPETATTYNIGTIIQLPALRVTADYWRYRFRNVLTTEAVADVYNATFGPGAAGCASPQALLDRFVFDSVCSATNFITVDTNRVNGEGLKTSGIDLRFDYDLTETIGQVFEGDIRLGAEVTYLINFNVAAQTLPGDDSVIIQDAERLAGQRDFPRVRANAYAAWSRGPLSLRWQARFASATKPQVSDPQFRWVPSGTDFVQRPVKISSYFQNDMTARWAVREDVVLIGSVLNIFNEKPPNRDLSLGSALGRVYEMGFRLKF
ncbi:TonB-dependent receptor [Phenylobacterium sp.]|uniref:TonB-dependent receptor domain-containing protein n=1 Tax=Phenylobacterium sp. TaxID=1871053 RepID=UPI00301D46C6